MTLYLTSEHLDAITQHAQRTYPEECCGLLIGTLASQRNESRVVEVRPTPNAWSPEQVAGLEALIPDQSTPHSRRDRFWIDPRELLMAQREGRDRGLSVVGIYHSHPDHAAIPSECDRRLAWPDYSYLIVSVHQGITRDLLSWKLDINHQFQVEELQCLDCADGVPSAPQTSIQFPQS